MAIINYVEPYSTANQSLLSLYPDQYVSDKVKQSDSWIKTTVDYFYNIALTQYNRNKQTFARNYELVKGILRAEDLYEDSTVQEFMSTYSRRDLPNYVQDYSILPPVLNTLVGEMSKRPDNTYVKAFDDDSKSEELQYKTQILQQYIIQKAKERIKAQLAEQGVDITEDNQDQVQQMTDEEVGEYMVSYTSTAEKWGTTMLEYMKVRFGLKEKSEESFRDLLIAGREMFHIYEDSSSEGINIDSVNPVNVWFCTTPNEKYISDPFDKSKGAYAAGLIEVMEMSEVINKFSSKLTIDEIKHLKDLSQQNYLISGYKPTLTDGSFKGGSNTIQYNAYDPLLVQERMLLEAQVNGNGDEINSMNLPGSELSIFGDKFIVFTGYHCSKKKIGKLIFVNDSGQEETIIVDENYKKGMHPQELDLEWGWINQWYKTIRIGQDIYYCEPFELLDYCPIIGSLFENRNTEVKSLVDMLKPFQAMYNIYINKLYDSIQKDKGKVFLTSLRSVPSIKDGDDQDALTVWEDQARERGVIFIDDSPENLKGSNFNQHTMVDMSRVQEMQGYYNLATQMKTEAWELVGITKQRLGSVAATETATGTNTALSQSYAQTEPLFAHHEYTINKLYQASLDAAQYIESKKPTSSIRFINNEGQEAFLEVNGTDIIGKELGVMVTSRSEDAQELKDLKQLSQSMLQNGASPYEIVEIYTTRSKRVIKDTFKKLKEEADQRTQQEQQQKQQELDQQQQQFQQQQQLLIAQHDKDVENDNMNKELDRENKKEIAVITTIGYGKVDSPDANGNGIQDILEIQSAQDATNKIKNDYALKMQQLSQKQMEILNKRNVEQQKLELGKQKLEVEKEKMQNDLTIARANLKNKSKNK